MENPEDDLSLGENRQKFFSTAAGAIIVAVTPKDRAAEDEPKGVVPVLPSPKNLKDVIGGVPGLVKGVIVDNVLPIMGAKPLSGKDQPDNSTADALSDAAFAVAATGAPKRYLLPEFDQWPQDVQRRFLKRLVEDPNLRASVASTVEGRAIIKAREIPLTPTDDLRAAVATIGRGVAPKKKGGAAGIIKPLADAAGAITAGITALDRLFAANPPDP